VFGIKDYRWGLRNQNGRWGLRNGNLGFGRMIRRELGL